MLFDLCIIGGGINGVGVARDAAGRGLKVLLLEKGDLGGCTSSNSSKMIHGGLRYLEFYEFGLVKKSLAEREVLMRIASQIVKPLRFCIPHDKVRPAWMVRIGLFIYDHLTSMRVLPKSETIKLSKHTYGQPLKNPSDVGFLYSDCWVDDARLVVLNAMDAKFHGAKIRVGCPVTKVTAHHGQWTIETPKENFEARMVINATGPYAHEFLQQNNLIQRTTPHLRLVQGSHIVIPKLYDGDQSYLIQCPDKRVVFVWPYLGQYTLVGTTEAAFIGDPKNAKITDEETDYLINIVNREFQKQITKDDIIWTYSGVRPLFDTGEEVDNRKVTRDYKLLIDAHAGAKILNIFGGKLTTYRPLAEEVVDMLQPYFPNMKPAWTSTCELPTIDFKFEFNDKTLHHFITHEWARSIDDVLWRRTKWGVGMSQENQQILKQNFDRLLAEEIENEADFIY